MKSKEKTKCGTCVYFEKHEKNTRPFENEYGVCYFMPPTVQIYEDNLETIRPVVSIDARSCAFYSPVLQ